MDPKGSHLSREALGLPRSVWGQSGKEGQQVLSPEVRERAAGGDEGLSDCKALRAVSFLEVGPSSQRIVRACELHSKTCGTIVHAFFCRSPWRVAWGVVGSALPCGNEDSRAGGPWRHSPCSALRGQQGARSCRMRTPEWAVTRGCEGWGDPVRERGGLSPKATPRTSADIPHADRNHLPRSLPLAHPYAGNIPWFWKACSGQQYSSGP